ncbi:hypothetical protein PG999_003443 [Apiospora kogelbergensis]|uniref:Uncharacterized protein n=1 Tax=Apiospora kogelbergensis TaxID=1337665 RepID=A0AAW0R3H9_9PEZI
MSRRPIIGAVNASNCVFEAATRRIAANQIRSFSSTPSRNAQQVAHFTPTSSTELDELLSTIRMKIILPSYLSLTQRKQLMSKRYEKKLAADPVIIDIDGEILKFRYLAPLSGGIPNTEKSVMQAVTAFETEDDFVNLRPLVEGIHNTNRKLDADFWNKMTRVVGSKGRIYEMIELARRAKWTGYRLDDSERVNELLLYVQLKAAEGGWSKGETEKALRWSEMVIELLQTDAHMPKSSQASSRLEYDPQVLLAPLNLASSLVAKAGVDTENVMEKVTKYARDVVRLWPEGKQLKELHQPEAYQSRNNMAYLAVPNKFVALAAPLLHGLESAVQVVKDPELLRQLQARRDVLSAEVQSARKSAKASGKADRGEYVYSKFFEA